MEKAKKGCRVCMFNTIHEGALLPEDVKKQSHFYAPKKLVPIYGSLKKAVLISARSQGKLAVIY